MTLATFGGDLRPLSTGGRVTDAADTVAESVLGFTTGGSPATWVGTGVGRCLADRAGAVADAARIPRGVSLVEGGEESVFASRRGSREGFVWLCCACNVPVEADEGSEATCCCRVGVCAWLRRVISGTLELLAKDADAKSASEEARGREAACSARFCADGGCPGTLTAGVTPSLRS